MLYGALSLDLWILGATCGAVGIAVLAALTGPLRRAVSSDPASVLRET